MGDPKPPPRVRDPELMRRLHIEWRECALCQASLGGTTPLSLHHVVRRGRGGDDVRANLVMLCGSGTTGCHGRVEAHDPLARLLLHDYLLDHRDDTMEYLAYRFPAEGAERWLARVYG